jgi:hypothetical protein
VARVASRFQNKPVVYDILFHAMSETLRTIAADPAHLGAEIGVLRYCVATSTTRWQPSAAAFPAIPGMQDTDLPKFRRPGSRAHLAPKQAETLAQSYRDQLADFEARIQAIAPDLQLPARLRNPNLIFAPWRVAPLGAATCVRLASPWRSRKWRPQL